ncbi:MAG TPA: hypothetical protein VF607_13565 [Verrucomicrobiae bacterium]
MKLRLRGNSLRIRITRTEITQLTATGRLESRVQLGATPEEVLTYQLATDAGITTPVCRFLGNVIQVCLPRTQALAWAAGSTVGLYAQTSWDLQLAVEKDFKCLDPRREEDESDHFENPLAAHPGCAAGPA